MTPRAAGLLIGFALDRVLGDPARRHPVAAFGRLAAGLERRTYADATVRGAVYAGTLVGGGVLVGLAAERSVRDHPLARTTVVAATTWAVLGGRSLEREAHAVRDLLPGAPYDDAALDPARRRLTHLVGRDTSRLDAAGISRAVIESVAENTSDAVVAPLVWGAVAGIPGLIGYRAANTLDAMVGHRSSRYERFGKASARLDDLLNLPASRLSASLTAVLAPLVGGSAGTAVRTWRRDARHHPSPNAGPVEAAFAGALGVRLGGVNVYGERVEDRHVLGDGAAPEPVDVARATRLARAVGVGAAVLAAAVGATATTRSARTARTTRTVRSHDSSY